VASTSTCRVWGAETSRCFITTILAEQLLPPPPPGLLAQLRRKAGFQLATPLAQTLFLVALLTLTLLPCLLIPQGLKAEAVPGITLPVSANGTTRLPLMKAIAELAAGAGQALAHLGKQAGQGVGLRRQLRPIEAWGICQQGSWCQSKQLHMARGVPAPLQPA
jgi:hypothetical protein